MTPSEKTYDVFISHSSTDAKEARLICGYLEKHGNKCWIAPRNIMAGTDYAEQIIDGLESSKLLLLVLSERANKSEQILREVERASSKKLQIIVLYIQPVEKLSKTLEYFLTQRQWVVAHTEDGKLFLDNDVLFTLSCVVSKFIYIAENNIDEKDAASQDADLKYRLVYPKKKSRVLKLLEWGGLLIASALLGANSEEIIKYFYKPEVYQIPEVKEVSCCGFKNGDMIAYGQYRGNPIIWSVIENKENGEVRLVANAPITYKNFDVAHSGFFKQTSYKAPVVERNESMSVQGYYELYIKPDDGSSFIKTDGSADWRSSTLRTWLNSSDENVVYRYITPSSASVNTESLANYSKKDVKNLDEKGFMTSFSTDEKRYMVKQKGEYKILYFANESCPLFGRSFDLNNDSLSSLANFSENALKFLNRDYSSCYSVKFDEYVTIPNIDDLNEIVKLPETLINFKYDSMRKKKDVNGNLVTDPSVSIWMKNSCGFLPSSVCVASSHPDNPKFIKIQTNNVTELGGVVPMITIKLNNAIKLEGNGTPDFPYQIVWR